MRKDKELLEIAIIDWEKHQSRGGIYENPTWFKCFNKIIDQPVWDLPPSAIKLYFFLLCYASRNANKTGRFRIFHGSLTDRVRIKSGQCADSLRLLSFVGVLEYQILKCHQRADAVSLDKIREDKIREELRNSPIFDSTGVVEQVALPKRKVPDAVLADLRKIQGRPLEDDLSWLVE